MEPVLRRCLTFDRFSHGFASYLCDHCCAVLAGVVLLSISAYGLHQSERARCASSSALDGLRTSYSEVDCRPSGYVPATLVHLTGCEVQAPRNWSAVPGFEENLPADVERRGYRVRSEVFVGDYKKEGKWQKAGLFSEQARGDVGSVRLGSRFRLSHLEVPWERVALRDASRMGKAVRTPGSNETLTSANMLLFAKEDCLYSSTCACPKEEAKKYKVGYCNCPPSGTVRIWFEEPVSEVSVLGMAKPDEGRGGSGDIVISPLSVRGGGYLTSIGGVRDGSRSGQDMLREYEEFVEGEAVGIRILASLGFIQAVLLFLWPDDGTVVLGAPCQICCEQRFRSTFCRASVVGLPLAYIVYLVGTSACNEGAGVAAAGLIGGFVVVVLLLWLHSSGVFSQYVAVARADAHPSESGASEPADGDDCLQLDGSFPPRHILAMQLTLMLILLTLLVFLLEWAFSTVHSGALRID